ncbi:MAG: hypothetical protein J6V53_05350 [Alphaproteobacteria bacterium]|nr:hypothetical protein [Alphaproteobacteria bacterium]
MASELSEQQKALLNAARDGDIQSVRRLLVDEKVSPVFSDEHGITPLFRAVVNMNGERTAVQTEIANLILDHVPEGQRASYLNKVASTNETVSDYVHYDSALGARVRSEGGKTAAWLAANPPVENTASRSERSPTSRPERPAAPRRPGVTPVASETGENDVRTTTQVRALAEERLATEERERSQDMQDRRQMFLQAAELQAEGHLAVAEAAEKEVPEEHQDKLDAYRDQAALFSAHADEVAEEAFELYQSGLEERSETRAKQEEELATERGRLNQDVSHAFPNFWQEYAPTWLGGWSDEELATAQKAREAAGYIEAPGFWDRYAPSFLGGWSSEEVEKYDNYMAAHKGPQKEGLSFWERHAPTWLGGKSDIEVAAHDLKAENATEVFKGVTIGELREAGYSDEKIHQMRLMATGAVNRQLEAEAGENPMGLINRFHQCATPVQLTEADYQSIGLNRQDMAMISRLSQNDGGRS